MYDAFSVFRDSEVKIFVGNETSAYGTSSEMTFKKVISADVQPINGALEEKEFSMKPESSMRMFYDEKYSEYVKQGRYAVYGDRTYRIEYTEKRGLGCAALLKEVSA